MVEQLAVIALGQAGGLSLDEILAMLSPNGQAEVDRSVLLAKADEIDATVKQLKAMSRGLRHAAACPAPNHAQCPNFQRLLKSLPQGRSSAVLSDATLGFGLFTQPLRHHDSRLSTH